LTRSRARSAAIRRSPAAAARTAALDANAHSVATNASHIFLRTIQQRIHRAFDVATALREHGFAIIHAVPRQGAELFRAHARSLDARPTRDAGYGDESGVVKFVSCVTPFVDELARVACDDQATGATVTSTALRWGAHTDDAGRKDGGKNQTTWN
jgi:hypothetical protein